MGILFDIETAHVGFSRRGKEQSAEDFDKGGFACPVRTEEPEEFTLSDLKAHVVQCNNCFLLLAPSL